MNLHELAGTLPNGFHDAQVRALVLDYETRRAVFELRVWVGTMAAPPGDERERMRGARLTLDGLAFCAIDPPDPRYPYESSDGLTIDLCDEARDSPLAAAAAASGLFAARFFVDEWNAFIHVVAGDAALQWVE